MARITTSCEPPQSTINHSIRNYQLSTTLSKMLNYQPQYFAYQRSSTTTINQHYQHHYYPPLSTTTTTTTINHHTLVTGSPKRCCQAPRVNKFSAKRSFLREELMQAALSDEEVPWLPMAFAAHVVRDCWWLYNHPMA